MTKKTKTDGVFEFVDRAGEHRIRIISKGRITYSSTEGYKNRADMRKAAINSAKMILKHYIKAFFWL